MKHRATISLGFSCAKILHSFLLKRVLRRFPNRPHAAPRSPNFATVLPLIPPSPNVAKTKGSGEFRIGIRSISYFPSRKGRRTRWRSVGLSFQNKLGWIIDFPSLLLRHRAPRSRCSLERNEKLPLVCGYEIPDVCSSSSMRASWPKLVTSLVPLFTQEVELHIMGLMVKSFLLKYIPISQHLTIKVLFE